MTACFRCGHGNPDGVDFCENPDCGTYLGWTVSGPPDDSPHANVLTGSGSPPDGRDRPPGYASPPPRGGIPPPTSSTSGYPPDPRVGPMRRGRPPLEHKKGVTITVDPRELRAEPGGPPVSTTVKVRNDGTKVEHFNLVVNGLVAPYAQLDPQQLNIYPGDEQTAQVHFAVPRTPRPAAGRVPFEIATWASVDADVHGRVTGAVTIGRFDEISATLDPEMTRGRKPGHHQLTVVNKGNAPLNVQVVLADQQGELTFHPARFGGPLAPGMTAGQDVTVTAPVKWFGRTQVFPFTGTVTTNAPSATAPPLQGRRRQVPRFPWWIPTAALTVIALLLAVYGLLGPTVPQVKDQTVEQARTLLEDKHYRVVLGAARQDPSVAKGNAIETDPLAGQRKPWFSKVLLILSLGPCSPEGCLVQVPFVQDYPRQDAEQMLTRAEFVPVVEERSDPQRGKGVVISSTPPGGQPFTRGGKVLLVVSSGPAATPAPKPPPPPPPSPTTRPDGGSKTATPPPRVVVPDVADRPKAAATQELTEQGLTVQEKPEHVNGVARDTVLRTEPAAGTRVDARSSVTVVVAAPTLVDLVALAPTATWTDGSLTPVAVGQTPGDPVAVLPSEPGAAGTPPIPVLGVTPADTIIGTYTLTEPTIDKDHLRAQVVMQDGVSGTVTVDVLVDGVSAGSVQAESGLLGGLQDLDVPLAAGATSIQIKVTGTGGALVKAVRIEGDTG